MRKFFKLLGKLDCLKNSKLAKSCFHYYWFNYYLPKMIERRRRMDPKDYPQDLEIYYKLITGKTLDLKNPKTFNEKIQWLKLNDCTPLKTQLCDKYAVRSWVAEQIGEEYLMPMIGAWDSFDQIDFDALPEKFVLKANHASGMNMIVTDKKAFNREKAKREFDRWQKMDYGLASYELSYCPIPRKIVAEEFIENMDGNLFDYKIYCFGGVPTFVQYIGNRATPPVQEAFYDRDWKLQPFTYTYRQYQTPVERPKQLDEMFRVASILSKPFCYVRVDLYIMNSGQVKLGEMTFHPAGGLDHWSSDEWDRKLGDMIQLPTAPYSH